MATQREMNVDLRGSSVFPEVRPVTPDDAADLPAGVTRALYVGEAGDVVAVDAQGNAFTLASGAAQYHPLRVSRILATGTSAAAILALY